VRVRREYQLLAAEALAARTTPSACACYSVLRESESPLHGWMSLYGAGNLI
jgi:hypothetical protein